jgi:hypothetical protein
MTEPAPPDTTEQSLFRAGAERGQTSYLTIRQLQRPITPSYLYEVMMRVTLDIYHLPAWNAGFLAGWFTAMCQVGDTDRLRADTIVSAGKVQIHGVNLTWLLTTSEVAT